MQKRPKARPYRIVHAPIALPDEFPIRAHFLHEQGDQPVTWLHAHDCLELGYCHEGAGIFVVGAKILPFQAGDVSVIAPAEVHLAQSLPGTRSRWTWLYLDPPRLLQILGPEAAAVALDRSAAAHFRHLVSPRRDPFIGTLLRELAAELRGERRYYRTAVRGLVSSLLVHLKRLAPPRTRASANAGPALSRVAPALDRMAENYAAPADARAWARTCHVSVTHFRRLFRRALGKSPHRYLIELRVLMAASRLRATREKIIVIAHESGFPTLSSFNRSFRQVMKTPPREWRSGPLP